MAGFNLGDIIVTIKAKTEDLQRGLSEVKNMADKTADMGSRVSASFEKSANASKLFATGVLAAGTAVVGLGVAGVKSAADFEQSRIAFETMLGSADKAKKMMSDIADFAKSTPFELPEVVKGSKQLLAFGFAQEQILPTMRKLGDLASGLGVPIGQLTTVFGQVRVSGRLMGQDLLQFTNAGVPIIEALANTMKKPQTEIKKLVEEGKVGFPEVEAAINSLTGTGSKFGGMMDKQSKSFSGVVSNIKDGFGQFLRTMVGINKEGEIVAGGFFDKVKQAAEKLMPLIQRLPEIMSNGFEKLKPWLTTIIGLIIGGLVPAVLAAAAAFGSWLIALAPFLAAGALLGYLWERNKLLFFALAGAITGLVTAIGVMLLPALIASITGFIALAAAVIAATWPFVLAGAAIAAAAYLIITHWDTIKNFFAELWWTLQRLVDSFLNWLRLNWPLVIAIITGPLGMLVWAIIKNWDTIFEFFRGIAGRIAGYFSGASGWLFDAGRNIILGLVNGMKSAFSWVVNAANNVADTIKNKIKGALGIKSPSKVFMQYGVFLNEGLARGLLSSAHLVQDALAIPGMNVNQSYGSAPSSASGGAAVVNKTNQTNITGPINIGSRQDADYLLQKLDRNIELESMGLATNE